MGVSGVVSALGGGRSWPKLLPQVAGQIATLVDRGDLISRSGMVRGLPLVGGTVSHGTVAEIYFLNH